MHNKSVFALVLVAAILVTSLFTGCDVKKPAKGEEKGDHDKILAEAQTLFDNYTKDKDQYYDYTANPFTFSKGGYYFISKDNALAEVTKEEFAPYDNDYLANAAANAKFDADVYCIPCVGQSLAINTDSGPSTFSETYPLSFDVELNNANLQDMNTGFCEGFKLMAEKCGVKLPENFKIITFVVGTGGTSINTFLKDTQHYRQVKNRVKKAQEACDAAGLKMIVPGFMWTQGEEDMRTGGNKALYGKNEWDPFKYSDKLEQMTADLNEDIKEITGQTNDIDCYTYQVACQNTYSRYPRIALEQLDAANENEHIIMSKTMYDVDYNVADYVHAPSATYRNMGNYYGMACFVRSVLHTDFKFTHVIGVDEHDNEIVINYEVPVKPLTLDTTLVNALEDGNYGFCIYNIENELSNSKKKSSLSESETKITKVEVISPTQIKLTLNRPLEKDDRLTYGVNGLGHENTTGYNVTNAEQHSGHVDGARGNVRDSGTVKNNNDGAVLHDLYSWATIWEYVPAGAAE